MDTIVLIDILCTVPTGIMDRVISSRTLRAQKRLSDKQVRTTKEPIVRVLEHSQEKVKTRLFALLKRKAIAQKVDGIYRM
mmetsp:Transcript_23459/g.55549  ORF Transcript_23459/g.55549 Transcript_23459/m.55549 type:complete len:80 (+) Transcript_23459:35-274(+)